LADLFSLLAVLLLFLSPYLGTAYDGALDSWMKQDDALRLPVAVTLLTVDMFLIFFLFLGLGATPFATEVEGCFYTFREYRYDDSPGWMFNNRRHPLEQICRKHR